MIDRLAKPWRLREVTLSVWIRLTTLSHFLHDHFMKAHLDCGTVHLRQSGSTSTFTGGLALAQQGWS
jgi:hypothetical protein